MSEIDFEVEPNESRCRHGSWVCVLCDFDSTKPPRQALVTDALTGQQGYVNAGWVETHTPTVTPRDVDRDEAKHGK